MIATILIEYYEEILILQIALGDMMFQDLGNILIFLIILPLLTKPLS